MVTHDLTFERVTAPGSRANVYRFTVEDGDGEPRVIDLPPSATVSELQNRL